MVFPRTDTAVLWCGKPRSYMACQSPAVVLNPTLVCQIRWPTATMWFELVGSITTGETKRGSGSPGVIVVYVDPPLLDRYICMPVYDPMMFCEFVGSITPSVPSPPAISGHIWLPVYFTNPLSCRPQMIVPSAEADAL